ncbi:radical SAM family heme chaperone HemW [Aromatoleum bremense]|uniref:Heme chaperone HemW n=1 Tax=Aromatoleum bremense TaxID=76115 RepID=A0ABX1NV16_9RHOO|nr:radical SAM family heme chaperone HemW [Aromatoleum bremense]NMG15854.1 oxygen-independent coproporphyrinogen III oxidase-like protein [Aromatoleum bremense]QTQ32061.1 Oxygen-independent coproporphyrinogen-III oxidase-like protein [Aromatoleum bremense]
MTRHRIIPLAPAPATPGLLPERAQLTASPPLALYVHYPWCVKKCPYCDFNSHASRGGPGDIPEQAYIDTLLADIETALPQVWGRRVLSVFIGGGTPSLMSAAALDRLLTGVRMLLPLDPLAEITLEANPGTVEAGRFRDYRAAGVNRLSLGIQSFDDAQLVRLGRIHDGREARVAIDTALANFDRVNLDLMYALPEQTLEQALADLDTALTTGATHLSCYQLTLEPNTPFHHAPPPLPDTDIAADMQDAIEARLAGAGFHHYETSAFARPGEECRHNLNYWTFGDYLGVGAGAHGKLSSFEGIVREMRHKHPGRYLDAAKSREFVQERRPVGVVELPFEFMMNALRLSGGVPRRLFAERTGLPLAAIEAELKTAREQGLVEVTPDVIRPTERGRHFLNDLLTLFLRD